MTAEVQMQGDGGKTSTGDGKKSDWWKREELQEEAVGHSDTVLSTPPIPHSLARLVGHIVQSGTAACHIHSHVPGTRGSNKPVIPREGRRKGGGGDGSG